MTWTELVIGYAFAFALAFNTLAIRRLFSRIDAPNVVNVRIEGMTAEQTQRLIDMIETDAQRIRAELMPAQYGPWGERQ